MPLQDLGDRFYFLLARMPDQEGDISWQVLRRIVQDWAGTSAELCEVSHLDGGSISTTLLLQTTHHGKAVVKISPYRVDRSYEIEAYQLNLLRALGIPTPTVYRCVTGTLDEPNSYLLMEYVAGVDLHASRHACTSEQCDAIQRQLAEIVCIMHQSTAAKYGRVLPSSGEHDEHWVNFFREVYEPTWQESQKLSCLSVRARKVLGKIFDRLERFIAHGDIPRLVHWDMWSSNMICAPDDAGEWRIAAIIDPLCKYAHAEAELAYMDLFHTTTPAFTKVYQQQFRLDEGYHRVRKGIYQLYPLLNHVCSFGNEYVKPLMAVVDRVSALV